MSVSWKDVVALTKTLPGVVEGTSYGTPALRVAKTFMTRLRTEDDSIVIKLPIDERDMRIEAAPEIYFITDHYKAWPAVLVRLAKVSKSELKAVLERAWRDAAPKKLLQAFDGAPPAPAKRRAK
ncbi:hypothetical protein sos41_20160 [Alphaproteobacteria bacterium SO-S41]|nr:hypothetical protein sos41_20160 [Alphaproteobacteria bacterium SO-S41]